jgi:hypothetical protein
LLTGFKQAIGSASPLFILLAVLAWLLIPFAHPVYVVTVLPCIAAGVGLAIWRLKHQPLHPGSISSDDGVPATEAEHDSKPDRWIRIIWLLAVVLAFNVPSPRGYWSAASIFLWSLVGDPSGPGEPYASLIGGATLLALYTFGIAAVLRGLLMQLRRLRTKESTVSKAP